MSDCAVTWRKWRQNGEGRFASKRWQRRHWHSLLADVSDGFVTMDDVKVRPDGSSATIQAVFRVQQNISPCQVIINKPKQVPYSIADKLDW